MRMSRAADKFDLYQRSVQTAEADARFLSRRFRTFTGRPLRVLREDFCGTAQLLCEFVKLHRENRGIGFDLDSKSLQWCRSFNFASLKPHQMERVRVTRRNVISVLHPQVDLIVALNYSYSVFRTRKDLLRYLKNVRASLIRDGMMILDIHGGSEVPVEEEEEWDLGEFKYVWQVSDFDPVTHHIVCRIHYLFPDGSRLKNAFVYHWRLWSIPELRELMTEAGFRKIHILWESMDHQTQLGNGVLRRVKRGREEGAWYAMLVGAM